MLAWREEAVKLGRIEADLNFNINASSDFLVNSTWGWLGIWSADLPGSGPTYPNPVPAVQVILTPDSDWTFQAAVFNGDPYGNDPEGNPHGLRFPLGQGALTFVELAYAPGAAADAERLPQAYKVGGWYPLWYETPAQDQGLNLFGASLTQEGNMVITEHPTERGLPAGFSSPLSAWESGPQDSRKRILLRGYYVGIVS